MTNEFLAFAPISATAAGPVLDPATALLDEMMARVGVDGLTAALAEPGLLARVDQHAAAIRDAIEEAGRALNAEALTAYAKSVAASAVRSGRALPAPGEAPTAPAAWLAADWHQLRLVALCMIADEADLL